MGPLSRRVADAAVSHDSDWEAWARTSRLLSEPRRQPNGYRRYVESAVERIAFPRLSQGAGLTLTEISDVDERLRELGVLRRELQSLIQRREQLDPADCTNGEICQILGSARSEPEPPRR